MDVMKEFQIRAKDGSKATGEAMGSLSKETQGVWKEFMKGNGTVSDVASTVVGELKNMDNQIEANQIAVSLFGTKWEDLEADAMYAMLGTQDAMQGFEGAMESVNKIQFSSFNAAMQGIGRILLMDIVYPIGELLLPHLNRFAQFLSDNLPTAIETAKGVFASIGTTAQSLFGDKINQLTTTVLPMLANIIGQVFPLIQQIIQTAVPLYSQIMGTWIDLIFNLAQMVIPLILKVVQLVFPLILSVIQAVLPIIAELITVVTSVIMNLAQIVIPLLMQLVQTAFPIIQSIIQNVIPIVVAILQTLVSIIQNYIVPAVNAILAAVQFVFPYIQLVIANALTIINGIIQTAMALLKGDWEGAWNAIKATAETIMDNIINFFKGINLFEVGKSIVNGLIDGIKSMGNTVLGAIGGMVPEPIRGAASKLLGALPGFATGGVVAAPTLAWVGEGGDTESIIPWNNSDRSKNLWLQAGQQIGMLGQNGALASLQQNINMQSNAPKLSGIQPQNVITNNQGGSAVIHVQFAPSYSVNSTADLDKMKQHAENDRATLLQQLAELQHNERRLGFES